MKKLLLLSFLGMGLLANAQAYRGKGDVKVQVGGTLQDGGTGMVLTNDYGIGENMSFGFSASYMFNADSVLGEKPEFQDRADAKLRFNANLGNVFGFEENMDIYPGLNLGTRNFGGHLGFRYFFTDGFGVYTEMNIPIAKYDSDIKGFDNYNNQFTFQVGASFNL